jgi:hypothetical protein
MWLAIMCIPEDPLLTPNLVEVPGYAGRFLSEVVCMSVRRAEVPAARFQTPSPGDFSR